MLVLTRQQGSRKLYHKALYAAFVCEVFPAFPEVFGVRCTRVPDAYDAQQREIDRLERRPHFRYPPAGAVNVSHTEKDTAKLKALYERKAGKPSAAWTH